MTAVYKFANKENDYQCVICLSKIENNEEMITNQGCSAIFHEDCFKSVKLDENCYQCREPNETKQYQQLKLTNRSLVLVKEIEIEKEYYIDKETDTKIEEVLLEVLGLELNDQAWFLLVSDNIDGLFWYHLNNEDVDFALDLKKQLRVLYGLSQGEDEYEQWMESDDNAYDYNADAYHYEQGLIPNE